MKKTFSLLALTVFFTSVTNLSKAQMGLGLNLDYTIFTKAKISSPSLGLSYSAYPGDDGNFYYSVYMGYTLPKTTSHVITLDPITTYNGETPIDVNYELSTRMFVLGASLGKIFNGDYEDGGFSASIGYFYGFGAMKIPRHDSFNESNYYNPFPLPSQKQSIGYGTLQVKLAYLIRVGDFALVPYAAGGVGFEFGSDRSEIYPKLGPNIRFGLALEFMPG